MNFCVDLRIGIQEVLALVMMTLAVQAEKFEIKWDRWALVEPHNPMENFFRRNPTMFRKSPVVHCECPPNRECHVDFKMNEDAIEFLHLRGVINEKEKEEYRNHLIKASNASEPNLKAKIMAGRRKMEREGSPNLGEMVENLEHCCCPPRSVMMPSFITDKKFESVVDRIKNQENEKVIDQQ